jgi:hypothetical protein
MLRKIIRHFSGLTLVVFATALPMPPLEANAQERMRIGLNAFGYHANPCGKDNVDFFTRVPGSAASAAWCRPGSGWN